MGIIIGDFASLHTIFFSLYYSYSITLFYFQISVGSVADVAKLANARTRIRELDDQLMANESKVTKLEDDLKRAHDNLRVWDENVDSIRIRQR